MKVWIKDTAQTKDLSIYDTYGDDYAITLILNNCTEENKITYIDFRDAYAISKEAFDYWTKTLNLLSDLDYCRDLIMNGMCFEDASHANNKIEELCQGSLDNYPSISQIELILNEMGYKFEYYRNAVPCGVTFR